MDISKLSTASAHEQGAELRIKDPVTGEPTDFYIKLMGVDSPEYQRRIVAMKNRIYASIAAKSKESKADDDYSLSEQQEIDETVQTLAAVTIGWRGLQDSGTDVGFSHDACIQLYMDAPRVRQQVEAFINDSRNFMKG